MPAAPNLMGVPQLIGFAYGACKRQLAIRVAVNLRQINHNKEINEILSYLDLFVLGMTAM